jgi:membrane dipeptidase
MPEVSSSAMHTKPEHFHFETFVVDMHCDSVLQMQRGYNLAKRHDTYHVDIPRLRDGGVDLVVFATTIDSSNQAVRPFDQINRQLDVLMQTLDRNQDGLSLCLSAGEVLKAEKAGKIGVVLAVEGGHALENNPANLERLCRRGVRLMTIVHEQPTGWCRGWNEKDPKVSGLNALGREIIAEMNSLGMIVDLSHSSAATVDAVCEHTCRPVVASHSCAYALCDHGRNLADTQAKAIAGTGGVVGVAFVSMFLSASYSRATKEFWSRHPDEEKSLMQLFVSTIDESEESAEYERYRQLLDAHASHVATVRPKVSDVADHIEYLAELVGVDHVAIGSDYDGMTLPPLGLEDCSGMPNLTSGLVDRGHRPEDLRKILGQNFLRVFKEVCG